MEGLTVQGLLDLGYALMLKRSYYESEQYLKQGFDLAQRHKQKRNEARGNLLLGTLYIQNTDADKGTPYIEQALSFYRAGDYRREISRCMLMMGRRQLLKGDFDGAVKTLDEQLKLAKDVEDPSQLARSQAEVAAALSKQDLYPQALVRYTESYELNKQYRNPLNAAFALLNRGDMLARLGRHDEANAALDELQTFLSELSDDNGYKRLWTIFLHIIKAQIALANHDHKKMKSESLEALSYVTSENTKSLGTAEIEARGLLGLSEVYLGSMLNGIKTCKQTVERSSAEPQLASASGDLHLLLAEALLQKGNVREARSVASEAQRVFAAAHRSEHEWRAWFLAARSSRLLNDLASEQVQRSHAKGLLQILNARWGDAPFATYSARKDVQTYRQGLQ
jgi:tetratricopeptide (TPR) repeat protein